MLRVVISVVADGASRGRVTIQGVRTNGPVESLGVEYSMVNRPAGKRSQEESSKTPLMRRRGFSDPVEGRAKDVIPDDLIEAATELRDSPNGEAVSDIQGKVIRVVRDTYDGKIRIDVQGIRGEDWARLLPDHLVLIQRPDPPPKNYG